MIINDKMKKQLTELQRNINTITLSNSVIDLQLENFLKNFEKVRYNVLAEIKLYNKNVEFEYEKIKTIDNEYSAKFEDDILKIYIPEVMPSFKNLKTHTHKRILLNVAEITKHYTDLFKNTQVIIYVKIFDTIMNWDIDNKFIKPIADGLIMSGVIEDDNITKMFYAAKGEYSETPHTEVYIFDSQKISDFLEDSITKQ